MIIILEGCQGSGKSTLANKYKDQGYQIVKGRFDIKRAKQFLEKNKDKNIVCDRLFVTLSAYEKDETLQDFNKWLLDQPYIKCYKLLTSVENTFSKTVKALPIDLRLMQAKKEHKIYDHIFSIMSCFQLISDLSNTNIVDMTKEER